MSIADEVVNGNRCMQCTQLLISEAGELCTCGHPVYCEDCCPGGEMYFCETDGEIYSKEK